MQVEAILRTESSVGKIGKHSDELVQLFLQSFLKL